MLYKYYNNCVTYDPEKITLFLKYITSLFGRGALGYFFEPPCRTLVFAMHEASLLLHVTFIIRYCTSCMLSDNIKRHSPLPFN